MNESKLWKNWAIWWNEINFNGARSTRNLSWVFFGLALFSLCGLRAAAAALLRKEEKTRADKPKGANSMKGERAERSWFDEMEWKQTLFLELNWFNGRKECRAMKWNQPTHRTKQPTAARQAKKSTNNSFFMKMNCGCFRGVGGLSFLFVGYGLLRQPMLRKEGRQAQPSTHSIKFHESKTRQMNLWFVWVVLMKWNLWVMSGAHLTRADSIPSIITNWFHYASLVFISFIPQLAKKKDEPTHSTHFTLWKEQAKGWVRLRVWVEGQAGDKTYNHLLRN